MKLIFVQRIIWSCCLLFFYTVSIFPQLVKEDALQRIYSRQDLEVNEIEMDLYKIENKITGDAIIESLEENMKNKAGKKIDSMVIEIFSIDTSLYSDMYQFWLSMDISNAVNGLLINDFNSNRLPELYANRTIYNSTSLSPGVFELNETYSNFFQIYSYPDTVSVPKGFYDIDKDGLIEILLKNWGEPWGAIFFKQLQAKTIPDIPYFTYPGANNTQVMSPRFGDIDKNGKIDFVYEGLGKTLYITEFNTEITNFDSIYSFSSINSAAGITIGDFDLDGKTDIITSNIYGDVHLIEAQGEHQYENVWNGIVEVHNAYYSFATNDIDKNGKPEFWVGGKHFTSGILFTCFETTGDNGYQPVFKVKIPDYYTLNPLTAFANDINGDGEKEIIICADYFFLVLKFSGSPGNHSYNIWYFNLRSFGEGETWTVKTYDINSDGKKELFFDTYTQMDSMGQSYWKSINRIYKPNFIVGVDEEKERIKEGFYLYVSYPNPFNPSTNVKFKLKRSEDVSIHVYNILGKEIKLLLKDSLPSGEYTVQWDGKDGKGNHLPGGVYFIQMKAGDYQQTIKSILLK